MKHAQRRRSRGQGLVEFALVAPLFFMIIFGVIEVGRLVWTHHELSNGTREGARFAMVRGTESNSPLSSWQVVEDHILTKTSGLTGSSLTLTGSNLGGDPGSQLVVTATYQYKPLVGIIPGLKNLTISHTSKVTIQH